MPAPGPYVLAIDVGTSGPKAAIVSLQGRIVATARAHVETIFLPDDGAEQDAEALWRAVKDASGTALRDLRRRVARGARRHREQPVLVDRARWTRRAGRR